MLGACSTEPAGSESAAPDLTLAGARLSREWRLEGSFLVSEPLTVAGGATRVGARVIASAPIAFEARPVNGPSAGWAALEPTYEDDSQEVRVLELPRRASAVQLRVRAVDAAFVRQITWTALVPEASPAPSDVGLTRHALRSELAGVDIRSREDWGARATRCTSRDADKHRIAIHHTVTPLRATTLPRACAESRPTTWT